MDRFAEEISVFIVNRNNKFINMYWKMALLLLLKQLEEKEPLSDKEADQMACSCSKRKSILANWIIRKNYDSNDCRSNKTIQKMWDKISQMFLLGSLSGIAVLGDVIREYLLVNLIVLFVFVNMGIILIRMYLRKSM